MRKFAGIIFWQMAFLLIFTTTTCRKKLKFSGGSRIDSVSYALGYQTGRHFKKYNLKEINFKEFEKAFRIALYSDSLTSEIPKEQINQIIITYLREQRNTQLFENQLESKNFIAKISSSKKVKKLKEGIWITPIKRTKNKHYKKQKYVALKYKIFSFKGKLLDQTGKYSVLFEEKKLMKGIRIALKYMRKGDQFKLFIPPEKAYGKHPPLNSNFAPNLALVIDLELTNFANELK